MDSSAQTAQNIETLKAFYAAINRDDIPATLDFFDPQIERIEPAGFPLAGVYRGPAAVASHLTQGRGTWAEGSCEPESFVEANGKIVALLYVRVRLKNKTEWIDARFADGFVFREGQIIQMRTFAERPQALAWAGIESSPAD